MDLCSAMAPMKMCSCMLLCCAKRVMTM
ncbi:UNVERIFIED_CONTAM: hypothetical protein GTU68_014567 [Idotea baltica]|nr:hypothetical protein [Idotea baltica]